MRIAVTTNGLEAVAKQLKSLSGRQLAEATAKALNDTGFQVRRAMQAELRSQFDRPTSYITSSPRVVPATADNLAVLILPTNGNGPSRGGKVGVDQQKILQAQEWGGQRRDKKSEVVLRRQGWLPAGYQTAIPREPFPGSDDGHGNISGKFMQGLISYLQMYEAGNGFGGNMKSAARDRVHKFGKSRMSGRAQKQAGPHMGRRYFIAGGRETLQIEGGDRMVKRRTGGSRSKHLQPGIWAVINGTTLRPVLLFVRVGTYSPRISMERVAQAADVDNYLPRRMRFRIREAAGV